MSSSFEWLELETLSREIANLEDRLRAARSTKNHGLMRLLEQQLDQAKHRRPQILEAITRHAAHSAAPPPSKPGKHKRPVAVLVEDTPGPAMAESADPQEDAEQQGATVVAQAPAEPEDESERQSGEDDDAPPAVIPFFASTEGASIVWDQLTPDHLQKAKHELARRRDEILTRHAEELKALEEDRDELEALDMAIGVFARKFSALAASGEVVRFEDERGVRTA